MASRRSERARMPQPPPPAPAHSASSSSASSNRAERVTRSNNKHNSSNKSSTPRSLSSDDNEDTSRGHQADPPQTRLRAREQDNEDLDSTKLEEDLDDVGSEEPEEEITRCICGHQEWPGPAVITGDPENDEGGGFFIQCDVCKVWQHGGCIGLPEDLVPEQYFCEECKPQLHRLFVNPQGQKYSWYLDVPPEIKQNRDRLEREKDKSKISARKSSVPKEVEFKTTKDRDKVMRSATEALKKRRSTMNSRAALDDDEVLRKVLEESKTDAGVPPSDTTTTRKGKRSRDDDDSEEISLEPKRPRTGSRSRSSSPAVPDDKDSAARNNGVVNKGKPRGAAARSQREKEMREEKERERAEAAGRRKGRAERRRGEDIMPESEDVAVDETPQPTEPVEAETPDTPSGTTSATQVVKKSGRPPQKRANRGGRNQQTRDTSTPNNAGSPGRNNENSPHSPSGRLNGDNSGNASDGAMGKPGKTRNWKLEKMSWNDIKKPAAAMLNYIQQRQVEMADKTGITAMVMSMSPGAKEAKALEETPAAVDEEDELDKFKKLNPLEMMDHLSRDIELWNQTV